MSDRRSEIVDGFSRQARAFLHSPLHRDPQRLRRLVERVAPLHGEQGLDVACGPGIVVDALKAAGAWMAGVDLTPEMLRQAVAAGAARSGGDDGTRLARAEAERLPFLDGRFDFVVCRNSFHHFPDPGRILGEMARVMRAGGRVVIEDMQAPEDFIERDEHEVIERLRDRTHARTLPASEFRRLLQAHGLGPVEEQEFGMLIDFDEWMDRAYPEPKARDRARRLMEAGLAQPRGGRRVFMQEGRLKFERRSLLLRAVRP